ncbi:MAG: hypothetical protein WC373_16915 [Smithella sp.]|jgi:hypothetical protein
MDRISYIFGYSADDKQIYTYTYSSAVGNFPYWRHVNAANELFHALGEDIQSFIGEHDDDQRLPYFWNHIEQGNTRLQGFGMFRRTVDNGDNIKRIQRNGQEYKSKILTGVGIADEADLLGIAYLPMTNRL